MAQTMSILKDLDEFFEDKTFVHGERLSVADIALVPTLKDLVDCSRELTNLKRYYNTVINQEEYKARVPLNQERHVRIMSPCKTIIEQPQDESSMQERETFSTPPLETSSKEDNFDDDLIPNMTPTPRAHPRQSIGQWSVERKRNNMSVRALASKLEQKTSHRR